MKRRVKNQNPNWETRWIEFFKIVIKFRIRCNYPEKKKKRKKKGEREVTVVKKFQKGSFEEGKE